MMTSSGASRTSTGVIVTGVIVTRRDCDRRDCDRRDCDRRDYDRRDCDSGWATCRRVRPRVAPAMGGGPFLGVNLSPRRETVGVEGRKRDWNPLTHREKAVGACYGHVRAGLLGATVPMVPVFPSSATVVFNIFRGGQSARCGPVASGEERRPATTTAGSRGEP